MKKILYSLENGSVCVVHAAPKEKIEQLLGAMSEEEYEKHVLEKSIPSNAKNVRFIEVSDIPDSREFRNAWVDVTDKSCIDVCCTKAKEVALANLRYQRNKKLAETDVELTRALESEDSIALSKIKQKRQNLRDITEPLKQINTNNKINDEELLNKIRQMSKLD